MTRAAIVSNRLAWDERAAIHRRDATGFYGLERARAGGGGLSAIERAGIGDVAGLRVAHLQCHIGTDTVHLARLGARVTGLAFSPEAVAAAREHAAACGVEAAFVEAGLPDARGALEGAFDLVFTTWGVLGWIPDLDPWGRIVASLLAPGGALFLAEGHPAFLTQEDAGGRLSSRYDWRTTPDRPVVTEVDRTYAGDPTPLTRRAMHGWDHPLSEVIGAVLGAGLRLASFREHETLPGSHVPMLVPGGDGQFRLPPGVPRMPLPYSLRAEAPPG